MKNLKIAVLFASMSLSASLYYGCKKTTDTPSGTTDNFDRGAMLSNYANAYILPAYSDMTDKLTELKAKVMSYTSAPDSITLEDARAAWRTAYLSWQSVDLLEFGPDESISLRSYFNIYPTTPSKINANITSGAYNLEEFGNKDAQGFPALDYLLNGLAASNAETITYYTTDAQAAARKRYLNDIADKMLSKITAVKNAWDGYKDGFISNTATDANSSISVMTNAFVLYYERYLRAGKIGLPAGAMTGVAVPEITEAYYTPELAKELALKSLESVEKFYTGMGFANATDGIGFKDYLTAIATQDNTGVLIADLISSELAEAESELSSFGTTIRLGVVANRPGILSIYQQLQDVVPLFKVDMVSALGISITYTDNDGD